jgi:hypothetical protein
MRAREFIINLPIRIRIGNDETADNVPADSEEPELDTMVPPLQQKLELMKRNAGMSNVFDEADEDEPFN